jgi:hypothetical protein
VPLLPTVNTPKNPTTRKLPGHSVVPPWDTRAQKGPAPNPELREWSGRNARKGVVSSQAQIRSAERLEP